MTNGEDYDDSFLASLGMTDLPKAKAEAEASLGMLRIAAEEVLPLLDGDDRALLVLLGLIGRAHGFHAGVMWAVSADNPHVAFTSLRAYAENAAALAYLVEKPNSLSRFLADGTPPAVGKMWPPAKKRYERIKDAYDVITEYCHPHFTGIAASHVATELPDGTPFMVWMATPRFSGDQERLLVYAWLWEFTEVHAELIRALGPALHGRSKVGV